ncbi:MAG: hypothetical protein IJW03_02115 [Clostridia bacterium]|nr:hypothetical protein [Clostridia bacterium]
MKQCAICDRLIEREDAPILTMGAYGNPKLLCDECAHDIDVATLDRDYDNIAAAMDRIGKKMSNYDPDGATYKIVSSIMENVAERAKQIKDGTYDFALDEVTDDEGFEEIPEELQEPEEDKALDERDERRQQKFDSVFNWISFGLIVAAVIFVLYRVLDTYVF